MALLNIRSQSFSPRKILGPLLALPIVIVIIFAIWVAGSSLIENLRFARATEQVFVIMSGAHDYISREKTTTLQPGEDVLATLNRIGLLSMTTNSADGPTHLMNPWQGFVRATAATATAVRIEMDVPVRDCRRMAMFFLRDVGSLGFQTMEARDDALGIWRRFLNEGQIEGGGAEPRIVETACGDLPQTTLALVFETN